MNFQYTYTLNYGGHLNFNEIALICPSLSALADKVTNNDRSAWGLYMYENEVGVGFHCEDDRDHFVRSYKGIVSAKDPKSAPAVGPTPTRR